MLNMRDKKEFFNKTFAKFIELHKTKRDIIVPVVTEALGKFYSGKYSK